MPAAGEYQSRVVWLQPTTTNDPTNGEPVEVHSPVGFLWVAVEEQSGRRQDDVGAPQTGVQVLIRIRNYSDVKVADLLRDEYMGYVYRLETIVNGSDELIVDGYRNDLLVDYEEEDEEGAGPAMQFNDPGNSQYFPVVW